MHKITNFTGQARHGWEKMTPSMGFGMSRPHPSQHDMSLGPPPQQSKRSLQSPNPAVPGTQINLSFNVPFNSHIGGPDKEDVLYSSTNAYQKWTHPEGAAEDTPNHALPVHTRHVQILRDLCKEMTESSGKKVMANVINSKPKPVSGMQRGPLSAVVTNVCISGDEEAVSRFRQKILNDTPITLRCETIDIDRDIVFPGSQSQSQSHAGAREDILQHMDEIADMTKADIFLLEAKSKRKDSDSISFNNSLDAGKDSKLRIQVYGDMESSENAKTRLLIMIDQLLHQQVDTIRLELSMHNIISGRHRKNIKMIESATGTAIYFPPLFPTVFGNAPLGATPLRSRDEIIITGETMDNIQQAKKRLHDLVINVKTYVKDVVITNSKVDSILLQRLDKIRKIVEANGSYVLLPPLGSHQGVVRVQATDILNAERTIREIMSLAGQFYGASWWVTQLDHSQRQPAPSDIHAMLPDICINSGAEITFEKLNFHIHGSDDSVKAAMSIINQLPFVKKAQSTLRVKVELAVEHKEFVSGKKNGKINKIMSQSNVQIVFDGFNEYNFYIDVRGAQYEATKNGLDLVELEMPASISFHVPDSYHKRIIGIGGQHIQRIMKKYSVFVKFSNAMDRGGIGKDDDDIKVDNVICRTPARNADNLELVKQEIMDMVEKADAEFVSEQVMVDRLYHRELIARMAEIEELEKKWNCKITFPGTEQASDTIIVSGPQWQVPHAVDGFLGMVSETHEIEFPTSEEFRAFLSSAEFTDEYVSNLKHQHLVEVEVQQPRTETQDGQDVAFEKLLFRYTRNNAGGLRDAVDYLLVPFIARGLDQNTVKGAIPRPKSDSFEDNMLFFDSKVLHRAEPALASDSPTRASFVDEGSTRSGILDILRKPGSMSLSALRDRRRKNGSNSPGSLFMQASNNASKASLISTESRDSGHRNLWNDSGVDLEHDSAYYPNGLATHGNGWGSFGTSSATSRPNTSSNSLSGTFETKFPFGSNANASTSSLNTPMIPGLGMVNGSGSGAAANGGDQTPKFGPADKGKQSPPAMSRAGTPSLSTNGTSTTTMDSNANADGNASAGAADTTNTSAATTTANATTNGSTTTANASGYPAPIGPPR